MQKESRRKIKKTEKGAINNALITMEFPFLFPSLSSAVQKNMTTNTHAYDVCTQTHTKVTTHLLKQTSDVNSIKDKGSM